MTTIDITLGRAFRVWWSYAWRSIVLSPLVIVPIQLLVIIWIVPHVRAAVVEHGWNRPGIREVLELMWVVWPIAIIGMIIVQTIAMRWMLRRARWADFKLIASSREGSSA